MNWGVLEPAGMYGCGNFAPIFDTARGLYWRSEERKIDHMLKESQSFEGYIRHSRPQLGWVGMDRKFDHFELIGAIVADCDEYREPLRQMIGGQGLEVAHEAIDAEFQLLMSKNRIKLVKRCLEVRRDRLLTAIG
jgi:hypothetical protein